MSIYTIRQVSETLREIRCAECSRGLNVLHGGIVLHTRSCEHRRDMTRHAPEGAATPSAAAPVAALVADRTTRLDRVAADLRGGNARSRGATEEEIAAAVAYGYVSVSDAMNQDD